MATAHTISTVRTWPGGQLPIEQQVLCEAIRCALGQSREAPTRKLAERSVDWDVVLNLAVRRGVAPLVHRGLLQARADPPAPVRAGLKVAYGAAAVRARTVFEPALHLTLEALSRAGLEPVVLKGMALAHLVYPEPGLRTLSDIDLLLPEHQLASARAVLIEHGFRPDEEHGPWPHGHRHLPGLFTPDGRTKVELHRHIWGDEAVYALDVAVLSSRTETRSIAGCPTRVLGAPDTLLHLCVHLAQAHRYRWFPLRTLADILAITSHEQATFDWQTFVQTVRSSHTAGAVYWPLVFSRRYLGAPIPERVLARLAPPAPVHLLTQLLLAPRYLLANEQPAARARRSLYLGALNFSLYAGCPATTQLRVGMQAVLRAVGGTS